MHSISEEIETTLFLIHSPKTRFRKDDDYRMLTKEAILKRPELQQIVQKYRHNIERSEQLALQYQENYQINPSFYEQYDVKCGLRNQVGKRRASTSRRGIILSGLFHFGFGEWIHSAEPVWI